MKPAALKCLLLAAPYCIHGYILDASCLVPAYNEPPGLNPPNAIQYNIETMMTDIDETRQELLKTATSNPPLSAHSRLLMDNFFGKAFKDAPRRSKIMARRMENVLQHTRTLRQLPPALPVNDVIVYCDLSRFGPGPHPGGHPVADANGAYTYQHPLGWTETVTPAERSLVTDCVVGTGPPAQGDMQMAWTREKSGNSPDLIQICPRYLHYLQQSGGYTAEQMLHPFVYQQQTTRFPNYEAQHWGTVDSYHTPTAAQKALRMFNGRERISAVMLERMINTLTHEWTHTSFWAAYDGLIPADDVKTGPSGQAYEYDSNMRDQLTSTTNANTIAYYIAAVKKLLHHGLLEDRLGMFKDVAVPPRGGTYQ